jgi:hypothetical protein
MALAHRHSLSDNFPSFQRPKWAEDVFFRAMHFFAGPSTPSSFSHSHADVAMLACVVRASSFVENQRQVLSSPLECSQSVDMSIVTTSSAPVICSEHFSSQSASVRRSADSAGGAFAFLSPKNAASPFNHSSIPSPAPDHLRAFSVGIFDHEKSPSEGVTKRMSPQSFTLSPMSPCWASSDEVALQSLRHHSAHYSSLLNILRNCWASRIFGRQCLPSEETAVVASFVQNYPLPATSAPDWEVLEFTSITYAALLI